MAKVNNRKTINRIAIKNFKASKMRNIFAIIAITLTCILFTSLFTVTSNLIVSMEESTMRQVGSSDHAGLKYLNEEKYNAMKDHESIVDISYNVLFGIAENKELHKRNSEIRYAGSVDNAISGFSNPSTGRLPQNYNEIATDTIVLERLGVPAKIGEQVSLEYSIHDEKFTETFTLIGFWEGDKVSRASTIWLDKSYIEEKLEGYIPADENDYIGTWSGSINFSNSSNIESKIQDVITESGFSLDEIDYGVNWAYVGGGEGFDLATILGGGLALAVIVFCGFLMISNVFLISISSDIRNFGLLKTIGTTGRQIKRIILNQAIILCCIGIPIGLGFGYLIGVLLTPVVLSIISTNVVAISANPLIFIISLLFTALTVFISISKPAKIASKVSPIEALRSTDSSNSRKKKKNGIKVNIRKMAFANVTRNKKKAVMVTISLALSLIIINATFSMANGFDMNQYLSDQILNDFDIGDVSRFNVHVDYDEQDTLNENFLASLKNQEGIDVFNEIYFSEPLYPLTDDLRTIIPVIKEKLDYPQEYLDELDSYLTINDSTMAHIYGLSDDVFDDLIRVQGEIDLEKLKTGRYVITSYVDYGGLVPYYNIGDKVMLPKDGTSFEESDEDDLIEYEVLAIAEMPFPITIQHTHYVTPEFFMPKDVFLANVNNKAPMSVTLDVQEDHIPNVTSFLDSYIKNVDESLDYQSRATLIAEHENLQTTYKVVGLAISLILGLIGIMNFTNTSLNSITARKRELATLQSIGMTGNQLNKMLIAEGLIYTLFTSVFTFTIGLLLGRVITSTFSPGTSFLSVHFTTIPSLICIPILIAITVVIPVLACKKMTKQSIVERLRIID